MDVLILEVQILEQLSHSQTPGYTLEGCSDQTRFYLPICMLRFGYYFAFFGSSKRLQLRPLYTDLHAKYVKRLGSAQGFAFWGFEIKIKFNVILGNGFGENFRPKTA